MRAEATGEQYDGVALLDEAEFACEKIFEVDQLAVAGDLDIRLLLEGQADVQAEALVAARATLGSTHDSFPAAGDHHETVFDNGLAESDRLLVLRRLRLGARRA